MKARLALKPRRPELTLFDDITRYSDLAGSSLVATSAYGYDGVGRLTSLTHSRNSTTIADYNWTFDAVNRITAFTNTVHPSEDATYSYDDTDQLTGTDRTGTTGDETYAYDDNGNRTNTGYSTGTNNQLLSDGTFNYTYDDEGNRSTRTNIATGQVTEYEWDHRNRLISIIERNTSGGAATKTIDYTYDIFNRRIAKEVDLDGAGTINAAIEQFIYDSSHIALRLNGSNAVTDRYLHGPAIDQVLADEQIGGDLLWSLTDNQGTVRDLIDSSGNVENHIAYDSFGNPSAETNAAVDHVFGATGREQDAETGMRYHRARYFDNGSWISEDPIGFSAGDTNLMRYVGNSASILEDPSGLETLPMIFDPATGGMTINPEWLAEFREQERAREEQRIQQERDYWRRVQEGRWSAPHFLIHVV